jgi:hypothetical protein
MLYSVRSERLLMEEIDYSQEPGSASGRRRGRQFLAEVVQQAQAQGLTSDEHFTVDGTLVEAWASLKSFQHKDQNDPAGDDPSNPTVNFHGEKEQRNAWLHH